MQNRLAQGSNQNYKVYIRVRPIDYQQKMVDITNDTIAIKDPTNKSSDKQSFNFTGVLDSSAQQDQVFKSVCEPMLQKLIEGHNSCLLCYGQTGSGKTFTSFGEDERYDKIKLFRYSVQQNAALFDTRKDRRGLVPRALEFLLKKAQEFDEIREFVITASLAELYLENVRDLGRGWNGEGMVSNQNTLAQNYETENLTIYENTNGQIMIKDLSTVTLRSINDLYQFLQTAFQLREKFESKGNQVWARAHTILTFNLVQKDRENENLPFMNASIQFIDLAGSERIAKSLTEGHKFQEAIMINSSLTALGKCLSAISQSTSKNIPYRESKLTRILQNCLTTSANVTLIAAINPSESNFEECLSTLQFADRTKNIQLKGQQTGSQEQDMVMNVGPFPGQEKLIKKLNDEIAELKSKVEFMQREHKHKLSEIQTLLGIDIDFDKIFSKSGAKDLNQFKMQKEAVAKLENVSKQNLELEHKIEKLLRQIEDLKQQDAIKQERNSCAMIEMKEQIRKLKDLLTVTKMNSEDAMRQLNAEREQEVKRMIDKSNAMLEEKVNIIINLPQNIQTKTNENQKLQEVKRVTKLEVEKEFKVQFETLKSENSKLLQAAKEQYEFYLKQKNDEIENFIAQFKKYREKKKNALAEIKLEMCEMYDIIQKQSRVIEKIESGAYSAGIKSFNIPSKDKPPQPTRAKLKNLYKFLDQRSLQATRQSIQEKTQQQQEAPPQSRSQNLQQGIQDLRFVENVDLSINLNKLPPDMLRPLTEKFRDQLQKSLAREKDMKKQLDALESINSNVDVVTIMKERDEFKQLYINECKKYNQSRVVLESQKRYINKQMSNEAQAIIRPATQATRHRYQIN